jgi:hypothetical protein
MSNRLEFIKQQNRNLELFDLEERFKSILGMEYVSIFDHYGKISVHFKPQNATQLQKILALPKTKGWFEFEYGGKTINVNRPYEINVKNSVKDSDLTFNFFSEDNCYIHVRLPIRDRLTELFALGDRRVTDCETHYFGGISQQRIDQMQIREFLFKADSCVFFGGHHKLTSCSEIDYIINFLKTYNFSKGSR